MNRRNFLRLSAVGSVGIVACWDLSNPAKDASFPVYVDSNMSIGHLVMRKDRPNSTKRIKTNTFIVGGGIAGLAAANNLKGGDFILGEMNKELGGTSSSVQIGSQRFAQGAHYDLSYPKGFGEDATTLLSKLNIVNYNGIRNEYQFVDKQHLIPAERDQICFDGSEFRDSPIPSGANATDFYNLLKPYIGNMPLPTRLIGDELRHLNEITFYDYLNKYLLLDPDLLHGIDYQMMDDYGGNASQVSALAGIHYYTCRNYFSDEKPELFSPSEGNYYFIRKLKDTIESTSIRTSLITLKIQKKGNRYESLVFDIQADEYLTIESENIIYAGQKNALKYVAPEFYAPFEATKYSPWVVVNFEMIETPEEEAFWQNDMVNISKNVLGFVNSSVQNARENVLTLYMCFASSGRKEVVELMKDPESMAQRAAENLELFFGKRIKQHIKSAHVKIMGHAMPIPGKGYLFRDANRMFDQPNFFVAGVDNGRLPLMIEALDSGIVAANEVNNG